MTEHTSAPTPAPAERGVPALQVKDGWKSFGHVAALRGISLDAYPGEVLAIVGDNGAGKSTMLKVLAGVNALDKGTFTVGDTAVGKSDPRAMREHGIATVFQDLAIVETLDIAANMFLGQPLTRFRIFADRRAMLAEAAESLQDLGVRVPSVRVPAGELSGGQRQGVAITRAVRQRTPIILMDEPTAALGVRETAQVARIIRDLRDQGRTVIIVCHDLEFIYEVADRVQVLRLGRTQGVRDVATTSRSEIVALITGAQKADDSDDDDDQDDAEEAVA